jgi:CHAT domain-containing protein/tetratricopeptide (TPR) repeat protein
VRLAIEMSRGKLRSDPKTAQKLASAGIVAARRLSDPLLLATSLRANGNALHMLGDNTASLRCHQQALALFRKADLQPEIARTLNATIQPLLLLGKYGAAIRAAHDALILFKALRDRLHVAYVETNLGNIYHRQDRFDEAVACYKRAYQSFLQQGNKEGLAVAFSNLSSCLIGMSDFQKALRAYHRARKLSARLDLTLVLVHSDFNVANLYYLRGEYERAIEMLKEVRQQARAAGDAHIFALTHLVLSDIYVELNLESEALEAARLAATEFRRLGMHYEQAKAICNEAMSLAQRGKSEAALELFKESRELFVREGNVAWPSVIDLQCASLLAKLGRTQDAKELVTYAAPALQSSGQAGRAVLALLLKGRLELSENDINEARKYAHQALQTLSQLRLPMLSFQASYLLGRIQMQDQEFEDAFACFEHARRELEGLRATLQTDNLKIGFIKDKDELYEVLVDLGLKGATPRATQEMIFECIEMAKSRSLLELMSRQNANAKTGTDSQLEETRKLIHSHYRRIENEQMRPSASPTRLKNLRKEVAQLEQKYLSRFRENDGPSSGLRSHQISRLATLKEVQSTLSGATAILEYFSVGENFLLTVIRKDRVDMIPLGKKEKIRHLIDALHMQLSKFKLGADYFREFGDLLRESAEAHLRELYDELVRPAGEFQNGQHLVIVPHSHLHNLPFHALHTGERYLIDGLTVSYAPSASIYAATSAYPHRSLRTSLIMGIPDAMAPLIRSEVKAVSAILPRADVYIGKKATEQVLKEKSKGAQLIHIATHGNFRQDNPSFSTIKLGGSYINLCDLYGMHLPADLITLSGCGTGLNFVGDGDEHIGLTRGFLAAGARSLLLSLWDVNDRSTESFMTGFYEALMEGMSKAHAYQLATARVRESFPHPYYWAPFILVGNAI